MLRGASAEAGRLIRPSVWARVAGVGAFGSQQKICDYERATMGLSLIFHIATGSDWDAAVEAGDYRVSTLGKTIAEVGFIHCSTAVQIQGVADRYYRGLANLVLLTIEADRLSSPLRFDPAGSETYPHIYGPLNLDAVIQLTPLVIDADGRVRIPPSLGDASSA
jgi:uncharacterized protein (DUF952 family)